MNDEPTESETKSYAGFYPREPLKRPVPLWVQITLAGVRRRSWAMFCKWAMAAIAVLCIGYASIKWSELGPLFCVLLVLSVGYCIFGTWIYNAAAKWVDEHGTWKG